MVDSLYRNKCLIKPFEYRYFGTTGFSEMTSSLQTAYGSDEGMLSANPNFYLTGLYHMYVQGMTSLFNYADHGPNKCVFFSAVTVLTSDSFR